MRQAFIQALCDAARHDKRIILITGDLGYKFLEPFRDKYPDQFINIGVAEANLITVAAGLATTGKIPFCYSIATFATMRPFEQIRNDVSMQNLNVKIVGIGAGLAYTKAGPTHHSVEDIGLMRLIPNMCIIAPADPKRTYEATRALIKYQGQSYLRLERNPSDSFPIDRSFAIGRGITIQKGEKIAIIATGTKLPFVNGVSAKLAQAHYTPSMYLFETIQPLDKSILKSIFLKHSLIATIEEHRTNGGFGSSILDSLSLLRLPHPPIVHKFGLKNEFNPLSAGYERLAEFHNFTPAFVASRILRTIKNR